MPITETEALFRLEGLFKSTKALNQDFLEYAGYLLSSADENSTRELKSLISTMFPIAKNLSTTKQRQIFANLPENIKSDIGHYDELLTRIQNVLDSKDYISSLFIQIQLYINAERTAFKNKEPTEKEFASNMIDLHIYQDALKILKEAMSPELVSDIYKYFDFGISPYTKQQSANTNKAFSQDYITISSFILSDKALELAFMPENSGLRDAYLDSIDWLDKYVRDAHDCSNISSFEAFLKLKSLANQFSPGLIPYAFTDQSQTATAATAQEVAPGTKKKKKKKKKKSTTSTDTEAATDQAKQDDDQAEDNDDVVENAAEEIEEQKIEVIETAKPLELSREAVDIDLIRKRNAEYKAAVEKRRAEKTKTGEIPVNDAKIQTQASQRLLLADSVAEKYLDELKTLFSPATKEVDFDATITLLCGNPSLGNKGLGLTQFNRKGSHLRLELADRTVGCVERLTIVSPHGGDNANKIVNYNLKALRRSISDLLSENIRSKLNLAPGSYISQASPRRKLRLT